MTLHKRIGLATGFFALITSLFTTGCTPPAVHPNQFNEFDGAAYDSLTLAHGALTSLRVSVARDFPSYTAHFNDAAEAYNKAVTAYGLYRSSQQEASVDASLRNLTMALVLLETSLESELRVDGKKAANVRASARHIRARAARAHISVSDLLTELQIAAALAQTVPAAAPYSILARAVVSATSNALEAEQLSSGKPIDLQTIPAIDLIS